MIGAGVCRVSAMVVRSEGIGGGSVFCFPVARQGKGTDASPVAFFFFFGPGSPAC